MAIERRQLLWGGLVQGVGFRPLAYRRAINYGVTGWVANSSDGVRMDVQGEVGALDDFIESIVAEPPRLAEPILLASQVVGCRADERGFVIAASLGDMPRQVMVTPDASTCEACLAELLDENDRRYGYPFINCTHCGPRYTIVEDVPYDRPRTTMRAFAMCPACEREYHDPGDRRFHAQPNACPVCGPRVWVVDGQGHSVKADGEACGAGKAAGNETVTGEAATLTGAEAIAYVIKQLEAGKIGAIKGLGGFHLAVRADCADAVEALRQRKYRKAKALALMVKDVARAREIAVVGKVEQGLLQSPAAPIVLCRKNAGQAVIAEAVAPCSRDWGVMLPYTPLHHLLLRGDYPALVMTSGNMTDEPIETDNARALERLAGIADFFLLHNRDIHTSCDDSVVKVREGAVMMVRRGRGYSPAPLAVRCEDELTILAVGAQLKNTITIVKGGQAFVSQHIGDLDNGPTCDSFTQTVEKLTALTGATIDVVACDLHPDLFSTHVARRYDKPMVAVQHHHAHIAAVMGEHDLAGPVIGIAADGLGWGDDGTVWGGEILLADRKAYQRVGSMRGARQAGGDAAAKQPWRMAVSYLYELLGGQEAIETAARLLAVKRDDIAAVVMLLEKKVNCLSSSSVGRLFDAASALLTGCLANSYEAQAAIELQYLADEGVSGGCQVSRGYEPSLVKREGCWQWDAGRLIGAVLEDMRAGVDYAEIAGKFHDGVAWGLAEMAVRAGREHGISTAALSGGVFQNDVLLRATIDYLDARGFSVYYNHQVPTHDGAISFGQAVVAAARCGGK